MSRFDLRDISERLTRSGGTHAVVGELLRSIEDARPDWRASVAFYEVSADALVDIYEREGGKLLRRRLSVRMDTLPTRMVHKLFGRADGDAKKSWFGRGRREHELAYVADPREAASLAPLTAVAEWAACVCLPLADQEDLIAVLVLVSQRKNAFGPRELEDLSPVSGLASIALSQHLHRAARAEPAPPAAPARGDDDQLRTQIARLSASSQQLGVENREKAARIDAILDELELRDRRSNEYLLQLEHVKDTVLELEAGAAEATERLSDAYAELHGVHGRLADLEQTVNVIKLLFQELAQAQDRATFARRMTEWLAAHLGVERVSLMTPEPQGDVLRMSASRGVRPDIAEQVRVRIGQGVAGWVAQHRKPLFVRARAEAGALPPPQDGTYTTDSFIVVPLVHRNRLLGVLNLSNKADGEPFRESDLDRAHLAASIIAGSMAGHQLERRAAAWA